jgi:hypothetical protein
MSDSSSTATTRSCSRRRSSPPSDRARRAPRRGVPLFHGLGLLAAGRADASNRPRPQHLVDVPPASQFEYGGARRAVRSRAGVDLSALLRSEGCARPPAVAGAAGHGQHVFQVRGLLRAGSRSPSSRADGKGRPTRSISSRIACWGRTFCTRPRNACSRVAARGRPRISSTDRERAILESAGLRRPARGRPWGFWASTTGKSGG